MESVLFKLIALPRVKALLDTSTVNIAAAFPCPILIVCTVPILESVAVKVVPDSINFYVPVFPFVIGMLSK
ncbi:hypothetical protein RAS_14000 [Rickettsia asiatica]|uniref:Uncharacterized protein n=1 Tax=Rickettsia asiatica TaxID=238800 RepID=A0A510GJC3_9RICK|nr:hypothetical protein RAS_14000 [Rickettsia asiatica]